MKSIQSEIVRFEKNNLIACVFKRTISRFLCVPKIETHVAKLKLVCQLNLWQLIINIIMFGQISKLKLKCQ